MSAASTVSNTIGTVFEPIQSVKDQPVINTIASLARALFAIVSEFVEFSALTAKRFQATQLTAVLAAMICGPATIINEFKSLNPFAEHDLPLFDRILTAIYNVSDIGDHLATAGAGLVAIDLISKTALRAINPIALGSSLLSSAGIIISCRELQKGQGDHRISKLRVAITAIGIGATLALTFSNRRIVNLGANASLVGLSILSLYKQGLEAQAGAGA